MRVLIAVAAWILLSVPVSVVTGRALRGPKVPPGRSTAVVTPALAIASAVGTAVLVIAVASVVIPTGAARARLVHSAHGSDAPDADDVAPAPAAPPSAPAPFAAPPAPAPVAANRAAAPSGATALLASSDRSEVSPPPARVPAEPFVAAVASTTTTSSTSTTTMPDAAVSSTTTTVTSDFRSHGRGSDTHDDQRTTPHGGSHGGGHHG